MEAQRAAPPRRCPVGQGCSGAQLPPPWPAAAAGSACPHRRSAEHTEAWMDTTSQEDLWETPNVEEGAEARPKSCIPHTSALPGLQKPLEGGKGWDVVGGCPHQHYSHHHSPATHTQSKAEDNSGDAPGMLPNPNQRTQPQMESAVGHMAQSPCWTSPCAHPPPWRSTHHGDHLRLEKPLDGTGHLPIPRCIFLGITQPVPAASAMMVGRSFTSSRAPGASH